MPFVKQAPEPVFGALDLTRGLHDLPQDQLGSTDARLRREAALALSGDRTATHSLVARLGVETDSNVRAALFSSLVAIGGTRTATLVAIFLRSDDPGLRNGAIEALKQFYIAAAPAVDALLDEEDSDLRLLAIEVTRAWPGRLAVPRLLRVIEHEQNVNVCAAAVDVATELGTPELLGALARLRRRFADQPFLVFAADIARTRIQTTDRNIP
jgi:HEAT repeat protein